MKRIILLLAIMFSFQQNFGQKSKVNDQLGLSIPVIYNDTKIFNVYSGARAKYISGKAISYGINLNYSRIVWKNLFVTAGIGYFNQNFGIKRPFDFDGDTTTKLLYGTKRYTYGSINWILGLGYHLDLNKNYGLCGSVLFYGLHSFHQKYVPYGPQTIYMFKKRQVETRSFSFGRMLNFNVGAYRKMSQRISLGTDLVLPIYTRWRKDRIFRENEAEFQKSLFSIGINLSAKYNLNY